MDNIRNIKKQFILKVNVSGVKSNKVNDFLQLTKQQFGNDCESKITIIPVLQGDSKLGIIIYEMSGVDVAGKIHTMVI